MKKYFENPALWIFLISFIVLLIRPIPECIDCEGPNPWGRNDAFYYRASAILSVWFVIASITAGFYSARKYWMVPLLIIIAHLVTQPLGGVPMWSLLNNEGPAIAIMGIMAGGCCLLIGAFIRCVIGYLRSLYHP
jgi:hypothetical protein